MAKINDRIAKIRLKMCEGDNRIFAEKLGISVQHASNICNNESVGKRVMQNILVAFPNVSREWLLTGEGRMTVVNIEDDTDNIEAISESNNVMSMPIAVWNVIEMQAASLRVRDEQMQQVINMLADREARDAAREQMQNKKDLTLTDSEI